jgi:hypothetical protein
VNGQVDSTVNQRTLELFREDAARANGADRTLLISITRRRDRNQLHLPALGAQLLSHPVGLPLSQWACARADANGSKFHVLEFSL